MDRNEHLEIIAEQQEIIQKLVADLVKLAVKSTLVLNNAQIPAPYAKETGEIYEMCSNIYESFVVGESDHGEETRSEEA